MARWGRGCGASAHVGNLQLFCTGQSCLLLLPRAALTLSPEAGGGWAQMPGEAEGAEFPGEPEPRVPKIQASLPAL